MAPSIDIDDEIFELLKRNAEPLVDTPSTVLRRLLGLDTNGSIAAEERPEKDVGPGVQHPKAQRAGGTRSGKRRAARGTLLPESEYELPILQYLAEHDGRAPSREVIESLEEKLDDKLTPTDRESLRSGEIRWKSRAAFVRLRLIERGDLDGQSPRGTWQITNQGRDRVRSGN